MKKLRRENIQRVKKTSDVSVDLSSVEAKSMSNIPMFVLLTSICAIVMTLGFGEGFGILNIANHFLGISLIAYASVFAAFLSAFLFKLLTKRSASFTKVMSITLLEIVVPTLALVLFTENGMMGIVNSVIRTINKNMAENHIAYVENLKSMNVDIVLAYCAITFIVTAVVAFLLYFRRTYIISALLIMSTMANIWFKGEGKVAYVVAALLSIFAVLYLSNIKMTKGSRNAKVVWVILGVLLACSAAFLTWARYEGLTSIDDLRDEVSYRLENIYYGKSDYPEGAFKRFHEYPAKDNEVRLNVKMEEGCELHLKGYVGCKYTEKGWSDNDENVYPTGIMDFFYKNRIYPLTQNAFFTSCTWEAKEIDENEIQQNTIHINNVSASQKYQYVTETLDNLNGLVDSKNDVNFRCSFMGKVSEYTFTTKAISDGDYIKLSQAQWYENQEFKTSNQQQFATVETEYRKFVNTKAYRDVPAGEKVILEQNIPACSNNIDDAISTVRSYLKGHIKYSEKCAEYNPDGNYLEQILLKDKRGFSPHFATVATLMFRYYGIPARYVEGYYAANEVKSNEVKIKNDKAHAWVEIYIAGLGFTPVEVTPGFYKEDDQGGGSSLKSTEPQVGGGGSGGSSRSKERKSYNQRLIEILIMIGIVIGVLIVLAIIALVIRRLVIKRIRNNRLDSENLDIRVGAASKYIYDMCEATGVELKDMVSKEVYELLEKIKFSRYEIQERDADLMIETMETVTDERWKEAKLGSKIKMVVWKGLR